MKIITQIALTTIIAASLTACSTTLTPETIDVSPVITVAPSDIGKGFPVAVAVISTLPITGIIGTRADLGDPDESVTIESSIIKNIQTATYKALKKLNFKPVTKGASRRLLIQVKDLQYTVKDSKVTYALKDLHFTDAPISIQCTLIVTVTSANKTLNRNYHSELNYTPLTTPSKTDDKNNINKVVSASLDKMMNDLKVIELLSQ